MRLLRRLGVGEDVMVDFVGERLCSWRRSRRWWWERDRGGVHCGDTAGLLVDTSARL